ncbi:aminoglycoside 3'-phosphotransferase [Cellulosimicrobium cellulans]|uniref:aminoglycoside 3'-phosphotransferase n=1 Tax=Cellulosimicrobium cellulans TaxID=1710 RepID=UPI00214A0B2C|nr:aminoglycoside 3'-phosphotransferase [Cellulosimicrobium cellulans]
MEPSPAARVPGPLRDDAWREAGSGESSARVLVSADGSRYAKVVGPDQVAALVGERDRALWAAARGIAVPEVLAWEDTGEGAVLVTRTVPGVPADTVRPDQVDRAWTNVLAAARTLHDLPVDGCPFDRSLDAMVALARDVVDGGRVHPEFLRPEQESRDPADLLAELTAELPARREQQVADLVVCHGDLCLPNVLLDPETLEVRGFVDVGRLGVADRHADLSLLLANAQDTWPEHARALEESLAPRYGSAVDPGRLRFHLELDPLTWG